MKQASSSRCVRHGLATAPDGLCVLCRRDGGVERGSSEPAAVGSEAPRSDRAESRGPGARLLSVLLLLAAVGGGAWLSAKRAELPATLPAQVAAVEPQSTTAPGPTREERDREDARRLAASLQTLERAEQERRAQEQRELALQQEQRQAAAALRAQEERERDAARHAAVAQQLEQQALGSARRAVEITLYGTDWCGVCQRARAYMQQNHIPYRDFDIERDAAARSRALALNPRGSVPTITIDRELLIGFSAEALEKRIVRAARQRQL